MKKIYPKKLSVITTILQSGGIGILPTDTLYGIVASALDRKAVARIYRLRRRNLRKPMIILISDVADLKRFGIYINKILLKTLEMFWPGKVTIILPIAHGQELKAKFNYLHRGGGTLAFRLPKPGWLRALLRETGPLVAPSANTEGRPPATTIREAKSYFGSTLDFYSDAGPMRSKPSTILKIKKGKTTIVRK